MQQYQIMQHSLTPQQMLVLHQQIDISLHQKQQEGNRK